MLLQTITFLAGEAMPGSPLLLDLSLCQENSLLMKDKGMHTI